MIVIYQNIFLDSSPSVNNESWDNSDFSEKFIYSEYDPLPKVEHMSDKASCCRVEAVVSIDSKGQIVLPKDVRDKAKLKPDDKLAVIACEQSGEVCCIIMMKADRLGDTIRNMLGPMLREILT